MSSRLPSRTRSTLDLATCTTKAPASTFQPVLPVVVERKRGSVEGDARRLLLARPQEELGEPSQFSSWTMEARLYVGDVHLRRLVSCNLAGVLDLEAHGDGIVVRGATGGAWKHEVRVGEGSVRQTVPEGKGGLDLTADVVLGPWVPVKRLSPLFRLLSCSAISHSHRNIPALLLCRSASACIPSTLTPLSLSVPSLQVRRGTPLLAPCLSKNTR